MSKSTSNLNSTNQEEDFNLRDEINFYLRYWPWFLLSALICILGGYLYLRYTTPIYSTSATIIIKDENKKSGSADLSTFSDMGLFTGMATNSIKNEMGILKSRRLMKNVGDYLHLNIRTYAEGTVRTTELYENKPINIEVIDYKEKDLEGSKIFRIEVLDSLKYIISNSALDYSKEILFGEPLELSFGKFIITPNLGMDQDEIKEPVLLHFGSIEPIAENYKNRLKVNLTDDNSTLIKLNLEDPVRKKAEDILNRLVYQYNQEAIEDKNQVSLNTAEFIEERLTIISEELDSVETGKQEFKTENHLTNIEEESKLFIENASEFRKQKLEVETQLELVRSMMEYLENNDNNGLLPSNLGFNEAGLVSAIDNYNRIVLERNRILAGSTEINPVIVRLDSQIAQMRSNVMESLRSAKSSLLISLRDLTATEATIDAQIANVPPKEKQFRNIERQQNIKEALYLFLLQKREETNLSLAATSPKAKIVDSAFSTGSPVSPKPKVIFLAAIFLGLGIPFLFIYMKNLLNNKIRSRSDMEVQIKEIPLVGEIPKVDRNQNELIQANDRSVLAESFRILHTNLQYLLVNSGKKDRGSTIFVTSTVKGEGKTFVAFNLAVTLANAGKKVLIVGGDLRNPQLQRFEPGANQQQGVSDYLVKKDLDLMSLIKPSKQHQQLDLLVSGSIPPNPSELWRQPKTAGMFKSLENTYDYVIVDTAPSMVVTDTFLINKYADITLYLVRAGFTEKRLLNFPIQAKQEGKLHDVGYILNDVEAANFGYGNRYGYYYAYGEEKPGIWERFRKNIDF